MAPDKRFTGESGEVEGGTSRQYGRVNGNSRRSGSATFNLLIVEDNREYREVLRNLLREHLTGVEVREADCGRIALDIARLRWPHLVFMDIKLPDDNGLSLTRSIKSLDARIAVAVLTSHDLPEYREAAYASGANRFLCKKSTSPEDILSLVESTRIQSGFI